MLIITILACARVLVWFMRMYTSLIDKLSISMFSCQLGYRNISRNGNIVIDLKNCLLIADYAELRLKK